MFTKQSALVRIFLVVVSVVQILLPGQSILAQAATTAQVDSASSELYESLAHNAPVIYGRIDGDGTTDLQQLQVYAVNDMGAVVDAARVDAQGRFTFRPLATDHYRLRVVTENGIDVALTNESQIDTFAGEGRRELHMALLAKSSAADVIGEQPSVSADESTFADPLPALLAQQQAEAEKTELSLIQNDISASATDSATQTKEDSKPSILLPEDQRPAALVYLPLVTQGSTDDLQQSSTTISPSDVTQSVELVQQDRHVPDTTYEVAAGDGVITGRVTDASTGVGIQSGYVYAREISFKDSGSGYPDASGYYTITGLVAGTYHVQFYPYDSTYLREYYNDQRSDNDATPVTVNDAQTTPNINAALDIGGKVTGRVTDKNGNTPLAFCSVRLYEAATNSSIDFVTTNVSGYYTFTNVVTGSYKVEFSACGDYAGEFYKDKSSLEDATAFSVEFNKITGNINGTLDKGGQITGRVTDFVTGNGIASVYVTVSGLNNGRSGYGYTDESGYYTITKLLADNYQVFFQPPYNSEYVDEYYNNQRNSAEANPVSVVLNSTTTNINAALEKNGKITGRVTNSKGEGVEDVYVRATILDGYAGGYAYTDASGIYTLTGLLPGSYRVSFDPSGITEYVAEYYNNQHLATNANTLVITYNQVVSNINAQLETGGRIMGRVTDNSGKAVQNANVSANGLNNNDTGSASTDAAGYYTITRLLADSYRVTFSPPSGSDLVTEYFNNMHIQADAIPVIVNFNATAVNISAQLERGGIVSGQVTNSSGAPMSNVLVEADSLTSNSNDRDAHTDATGTYTITRLAEDNYRIQFTPPVNSIYVGEYYNNQRDYASADKLSVTYSSVKSNINAQLELGGQIKGHITDQTGKALQGVKVSASTSTIFYGGYGAVSDASGNYTITGLLTGEYYVLFDPDDNQHISEMYENQRLAAKATLVSVTLGKVATGINANLEIGGKISGRVTDASGAGFANVNVRAYGFPDAVFGTRFATTDVRGYYTVTALYPGLYYMEFAPPGKVYLTEYYDNQLELVASKPVTALLNSTTPNINAQLAIGGGISGKVTNASNEPLANVAVYAYSSLFDPTADASTNTDASGVYTLTPLSAGTKYVRFVAPSFGESYANEYYNNRPTRATADPVTVAVNQTILAADADNHENTVPNINAVLEKNAGSIRGKITDNTGAAVGDVRVYAYASPVENAAEALGTSDASGNYTITALAPGNYYLHFDPVYDTHVSEYYNDQSTLASSDPVNVKANAATGNINAVLQKLKVPENGLGTISGKVTTSAGKPVNSALVSLYRSTTSFSAYVYVNTNASGLYTFTNLATGVYYPLFTPPGTPEYQSYLPEYYNNKHRSLNADPITLTANITLTNINAALDLGGALTGKVTDPNGKGLADVSISLSESQGGNTIASTQTDATGSYTVSKLVQGSYYVQFRAPSTLNLLTEYYNNQHLSSAAAPVAITLGVTTTNINAQLETGGMIQGLVTGADTNKPLAGVSANIYKLNNCDQTEYVDDAITDATGHYTVTGLATGSYFVFFYPEGNQARHYLYQNYNNNESFPGDSVSVTAGSATTGINAKLQPGAQISGKVTAADLGVPLNDVRVWIYRETDGNFRYYTYAYTDNEGNYASSGLPAGRYKIIFDPSDSAEAKAYFWEYYNDKSSFESATVIDVATGAMVNNINGVLARGGQIAGTVVDDVKLTGIRYGTVAVYTTTVGSPYAIAYATTNQDGIYLTEALAPGTYYLSFGADGYIGEFYNNKPKLNQATAVKVTGTAITKGIGAGLKYGAEIRGNVQDSAGSRLYDIRVTADGVAGNFGVAYTDSYGNYAIRGLPSDSYRVTFHGVTRTVQCNTKQYGTIYYKQRTRFEDADLVAVVAPDRSNSAIQGAGVDESDAVPAIAYGIDAILPVNGVNPPPTPIPGGGAKIYLPVVQR